MHNAPSVIYPVGRCRWFAVLLGLLAALALLMLILWWATVSPSSTHRWAGWAGAVLWLAWVVWAGRSWRRSSQGWLEWDARAPAASLDPSDGQGAWRWRDASQQTATSLEGVELAVDLQMLTLLRLQGAGRHPRWAWMEQWRAPARWNDLRRALHSPGA